MAQYDFSPRDRTGGITYQDRVGANPSILTQVAQAGVPVLEALKRRQEQIAREQAIAAVSKELQAGGDVTSPQALELGMRSGLFDAKGVMEMRANAGLKKAQADLASQKAEQIKKALAAGGILWWDENNIPHVIPVDPKYAGTRAFGEREPDRPSNVNPWDAEKARLLREMLPPGSFAKPGANPNAQANIPLEGNLSISPIGGKQPKPPAGFVLQTNKKTGQRRWFNPKSGMSLPVQGQ